MGKATDTISKNTTNTRMVFFSLRISTYYHAAK